MNQLQFTIMIIICWTCLKWFLQKVYWWYLVGTGHAMTVYAGVYKVHLRVRDKSQLYDAQRSIKDSLKPKENDHG